MRKFFEKHDLFKLAGIFLLIAVLLTWICSSAYYSEGKLITDEISRIGLFDISTYGLLGLYYFTVIFIFIFISAGFYKFLGSLDAYQKMTDNIAKIFKGKEKIFVALSTLIFAALAGIVNEYFVLLAFIPLAISILAKLKVDKITGLSATFGGVLVGIIGATYSTKIAGQLVTTMTLSYGFELLVTIILFVIAYVLLNAFTFARMNKVAKDKKTEILIDPFAVEDSEVVVAKETKKTAGKKAKGKKVNTIPMVIILIIMLVITALAFISWEDAFTITIFTDAYNWIEQATLFDEPIFADILGTIYAFGKWDLFGAACLMFIATLLIKIVYRVPFDRVLEKYGEGFKKISKAVVVLLVIYAILEFTVIYPVIPGLVDKILGFGTNIFTLFASGVLTSIFAVDFQYTASLVGSVFATFENTNVAGLALQGAYGIVSFIAPTSAILMLGLSMLDIKFSSWFKHIWKYVIAMIIVVLIILAILMYV